MPGVNLLASRFTDSYCTLSRAFSSTSVVVAMLRPKEPRKPCELPRLPECLRDLWGS